MGAIIIIAIVIFIIYKVSDSNAKRREDENRRQIAAQKRREELAVQQRLAEQKERERQQKMHSYQMIIPIKVDKDSILQLLQSNGISTFYHFTAVNNIPLIKKYGGLFSWAELERKNIVIPNPGGTQLSRQLDVHYGLQNYVRLSFCNDHPMIWRLQQSGVKLVLLMIDINVATWDDTLFSNMNATDSGHSHGKTLDDLRRVNFYAVKQSYLRRDDPNFKPHQAEIMVRNFIPIQYIKNINSPLYI